MSSGPSRRYAVSQALKRTLSRAGVSLQRRSSTLAGTRRALLRGGGVGLVIDVGAHKGEYARALRDEGYAGPIVSFEPVAAHFAELSAAAATDPVWEVRNAGVGAETGRASIGVSGNEGFSSSLLEIDDAHVEALGDSSYERHEDVEVVTLAAALAADPRLARGAYLKIDTQGFERPAIEGAGVVLDACVALELELSLRTLYKGQPLIGEMIDLVRQRGFAPIRMEPEFADPRSGELLQANCLFRRL